MLYLTYIHIMIRIIDPGLMQRFWLPAVWYNFVPTLKKSVAKTFLSVFID